MLVITGTVTGREQSAGKLDDGSPWSKDVLGVLDGMRVREVRVDKGWEGPLPKRGDNVAIACGFGYNNKLEGKRLLPETVVKSLDAVEHAAATH